MTQQLQKAFEQASKLPDALQDEIAEQLLYDLESESGWQSALQAPQDKLGKLVDKAKKDVEAGQVKKMGFDEL